MKTLMLSEGNLARQRFVAGATPEFLNVLATFAEEVSFRKGDVIFHENEVADRFFLILTGKVALESYMDPCSSLTIQTLGPGEVLGWSWLFPPFQWHFTARAIEPCTAIALNGASLLIRAEEDPSFGYELMKRVSRQVISRLQATRERYIRELSTTCDGAKGRGRSPASRATPARRDGKIAGRAAPPLKAARRRKAQPARRANH